MSFFFKFFSLVAQRRAYEVRHNSAVATASISLDCHENNGDDERYPTRFASFTKGLPHDMIGLVDPAAYNALLNALNSGKFEDFETIPLGSINGRKFVNPQSGLAFELASADVQSFVMPPAPAFASANTAGDIVILYWMALLRDVNFDQFSSNNLVGEAVSDLQKLSDYVGERPINRGTVFRGNRGNLIGPYISQVALYFVIRRWNFFFFPLLVFVPRSTLRNDGYQCEAISSRERRFYDRVE